MSDKIDELARYEKGPLTVVVELHADHDADVSHLGELTDTAEDYVFDRKIGYLLVGKPEPEYDDYVPCPYDVDGITEEEVDAAEAEYDAVWDEWDAFPWEVLADTPWARWGRMEFRYFKPSENHRPPGREKAWGFVSKDELEEHYKDMLGKMRRFSINAPDEPTREEATTALDLLYMCQDYGRYEGLFHGDWSMTGIVVEIYVDDELVAADAAWGIESDCAEEEKLEIVEGLTLAAMGQLAAAAERLDRLAAKIREAVYEGGKCL